MSSLDHKSNFVTTIALAAGALSLTEKISIILGVIVLIMAGVSNWFSIRKNKQAFENEVRKSKMMDNYEK